MLSIKIIRIFLVLSLFVVFFAAPAIAEKNEIFIIRVSDAIGPGVADFLKQGIEKASEENAACIIIELDTPGGLVESMRKIVMEIYGSKVPVVVYVSPSGARAASAGVMITMAADIAAMAPGTNIGAAHPVGSGGKEIGKTMSEKITNDMVAYVKGIAKKRGRNEIWAEKAVRDSISATETEALNQKVIDIIASDIDDLIKKINGRLIAGKGKLNLDNATKRILKETFRTKVLKTISNPNIAYILMMLGMA
ncbi:hypothetical protein LCGC14_3037740, partial [marine sediment metagenome]